MANKRFWFGILVLTLVFGMAVVGCDNGGGDDNDGNNDNGNKGNGGTFTMTGIPAEYNGKYALLEAGTDDSVPAGGGNDSKLQLMGAQSINWTTETFTLPRISGGSVNIPLWIYENNNRYFGNHTLRVTVWIINSAIWSDLDDDDQINLYDVIGFGSVAFSNGNATRSWSDGGNTPNPGGNTDVPPPPETITAELLSVAANGSTTTSTTALTLIFDKAITMPSLTASNITLTFSNGAAGTMGSLSGSGSVYTLGVTVTASGTVTVAVSSSVHTLTGSPKEGITVFYVPGAGDGNRGSVQHVIGFYNSI